MLKSVLVVASAVRDTGLAGGEGEGGEVGVRLVR